MIRLFIITFTVLLFTACATGSNKAISYYHFNINKTATKIQSSFKKPRLEILPVILPEYLNARGIAQRIDQQRTVNANWHLWASQPASMLHRTALNLFEIDLPQWFVIGADEPWLSVNREQAADIVRLQIKLENFNGGLHKNAKLSGNWTLFDEKNILIMRQNFNHSVVLDNNGYNGLAEALQKGWVTICHDISMQIMSSNTIVN